MLPDMAVAWAVTGSKRWVLGTESTCAVGQRLAGAWAGAGTSHPVVADKAQGAGMEGTYARGWNAMHESGGQSLKPTKTKTMNFSGCIVHCPRAGQSPEPNSSVGYSSRRRPHMRFVPPEKKLKRYERRTNYSRCNALPQGRQDSIHYVMLSWRGYTGSTSASRLPCACSRRSVRLTTVAGEGSQGPRRPPAS